MDIKEMISDLFWPKGGREFLQSYDRTLDKLDQINKQIAELKQQLLNEHKEHQ